MDEATSDALLARHITGSLGGNPKIKIQHCPLDFQTVISEESVACGNNEVQPYNCAILLERMTTIEAKTGSSAAVVKMTSRRVWNCLNRRVKLSRAPHLHFHQQIVLSLTFALYG
jgi:hypothetical protein